MKELQPVATEIETVINQSGLQPTKAEVLTASFSKYFANAKSIVGEVQGLEVKDEADIVGMQKAREARLKLKNIRVEAEKVRVKLKEDSRREGLAIDGVNNVLKALIIPVEEYLEVQEKFAENKQKKMIEDRYQARIERLQKVTDNVLLYNVMYMEDDSFEVLFKELEGAFNARIEAEKKAEEDRMAKAKQEQEEQERIRIENIRLKGEADAAEKKHAVEMADQQKKIDAERIEREKAEAVLKAEREKKEKQEAEERVRIEAEEKARKEAEYARAIAPDKTKLMVFMDNLATLEMPAVTSKAARDIVVEVENEIMKITDLIAERTKKL